MLCLYSAIPSGRFLVTGLTQVLDDGMNAYLYGLDRVGEAQPSGWAYHLPDALGSVRQLTDADPGVTLAQSYEPFGNVMASSGLGETNYSYTGEWADGTGLMHLRARYFSPLSGRFIRRDDFRNGGYSALSHNLYLYVKDNPINWVDPLGLYRWSSFTTWQHIRIEDHLASKYGGPGEWKMHLEYEIGNNLRNGAIDIVYLPAAYNMRSSFFPISNPGYIYDIKRFGDDLSLAQSQLQRYLHSLRFNRQNLSDSSEPEGIGYDWRYLSWERGITPIPPEPEIVTLNGDQHLLIWYEGDGIIMYAWSRWKDTDPKKIRDIPYPIFLDWLKLLKEAGKNNEAKELEDVRKGDGVFIPGPPLQQPPPFPAPPPVPEWEAPGREQLPTIIIILLVKGLEICNFGPFAAAFP